MAPCSDSHEGGQLSTPALDHNVQTPAAQSTGTANPAVPADQMPQTPEFLQKLIRELEVLRNKDSEIWAKMYRDPSPLGGRPKKSYEAPYEVMEELRRQSREVNIKMAAIKDQINELRPLMARSVQPMPETEKVMGPTAPPSPEPPQGA